MKHDLCGLLDPTNIYSKPVISVNICNCKEIKFVIHPGTVKKMAAKIVQVSNINLLGLDAPDLVYLFGLYVDVLGIDVNFRHAFIKVPNQSQATRAIRELNCRFVHQPNGNLVPLYVSRRKSLPAGRSLEKPPPARTRLDLVQPIWRFCVSNLDSQADFKDVLQLFKPFGTICWSCRSASGTYGAVLVKTSTHWKNVLDSLEGTTLAGHRLKISIGSEQVAILPVACCKEEIADATLFYVGNMSNPSETSLTVEACQKYGKLKRDLWVIYSLCARWLN